MLLPMGLVMRSATARLLAVALLAGGLVGGVVGSGVAWAAVPSRFASCAAMYRYYPHGVGRPGARDQVRGATRPVTIFSVSVSLYGLNRRLDRDGDGIACERL